MQWRLVHCPSGWQPSVNESRQNWEPGSHCSVLRLKCRPWEALTSRGTVPEHLVRATSHDQ